MNTQIDLPEAALSGDGPVLDLPFDHRRLSGQSSLHPDEMLFVLTPDLTRRLATLAERECVSLPVVYLAAYAILLSRYGNTPEVNIGFLEDGGSAAVVRTSCLPDLSVMEFLRATADSVAAGERTETANAAALCHAGFMWQAQPRTAPPA